MPRTTQKKNPMLAKNIGQTIARYRISRGLTQEEVAEYLGIGLEAISRLERGVVMPTVERLSELAEIFECNISDLITEGSTRAQDQNTQLHGLFANLTSEDREMVLDMVRRLCQRLQIK